MGTRPLSIRIDEENFKFISSFAKEENENLSEMIRELIDRGRIMLAIERYRKGEASIEKAAKIAGLSISTMMDLLREYGIEANIEFEDYLTSLKTTEQIW